MCTSSSCGDSGDSGDSGDAGAPGSTPFIATWDGKKFTLENDFLFGKPKTNVSFNFEKAKLMYESGNNSGDFYLIQNQVKANESKYTFQIREIEPEVSYIDTLSISYFEKNSQLSYLATSDHSRLVGLTKKSLADIYIQQQATFNKKDDLSAQFKKRCQELVISEEKTVSFMKEMEQDDIIEIEVKNIPESGDVYLLLESVYRDWTIGEIFKKRKTLFSRSFKLREVAQFYKSPVKMISLAIIFGITTLGFGNIRNRDKGDSFNESVLSRAFDLNVAHADIPYVPPVDTGRSLEISYYSYADSNYTNIEIIEPRYYQTSSNLILVPREAVKDSRLLVRVLATKKHRVTCASVLCLTEPLEEVTLKELNLEKAYHRRTGIDYAKSLGKKNGDYLVTWPGDIVDLEFKKPTVTNQENFGFVLKADGFYTAATIDVQDQVGDWVSRLDKESAEFLKSMHAHNNPRNKRVTSL